MLKEFREFVMRGNVMDLAVGVIIGGASGESTIASSRPGAVFSKHVFNRSNAC